MRRDLLIAMFACAIGCSVYLPVSAQTVSLPTFHVFSYSGTVEVPVGGSASLGGNSVSSMSRSQRGGLVPGPITRAGTFRASGASITATIIDQQEMDRQILGQTPQQLIARHRQVEAQRDREARGTRLADPNEEGKALVRHARSMYRKGQYSAAQDSYELAVSVLEPTLRDLAITEMRRSGLR